MAPSSIAARLARLLCSAAFLATFCTQPFASTPPARVDARALDSLAVPFAANEGQTDDAVAYVARLFSGTLFVTHDGALVYSLPARERAADGVAGWTLTERFVRGRTAVRGIEPSVTKLAHLVGDDAAKWRTGIDTFNAVSLGEVWRGVSVELRARPANVEKLFTVAPGASARTIRLSVDGAQALRVDASGALVVRTRLGDVQFTPPVAFQVHDGVREPVTVAYRVSGREYGFDVGRYDNSRPLIIDPVLQSTYAGGSGVDSIRALAVAASGDIYAAGQTSSTNFPGTAGGAQATNQGGVADAFVARFNSSLTALLQATYFGGSGNDLVNALALNATEVFIGGATTSSNLPNSAGGAVPTNPTPCSPFLARLPLALTSVTQTTYLVTAGGATCPDTFLAEKRVNGIALTGTEVYAVGQYNQPGFPTGAGGPPAVPLTGAGFVVRLNLALTAINQASGIGVSGGLFSANAIALTGTDVYVAGDTNQALVGTVGGANPTLGAGRDGYVMRMNPALTAVQQTTYIGGNGADFVSAMVLSGGEVFVHGNTGSTDLPNVAGGAQPALSGPSDAFVARFNAALTTNPQTTYLGGTVGEAALSMTATAGSIYVAGTTNSTNFPNTAGGIEPNLCSGGGLCSYIARLAPSLTTLVQSTYFGGPTQTETRALAGTGSELIAAGLVVGNGLPGAAGGAQAVSGGAATADGYLSRLTLDLLGGAALPTISIGDVTGTEGNAGTTNFAFLVTLSAMSTQTVTVQFSTADGTAQSVSDYAAAAGQVTFAPGVVTQTVTIQVQGDLANEPNETFFVNLATPTNATIADGQGLGTIVNDDAGGTPAITINDVAQAEGNAGTTNFVFTVSISSTANASVSFATADGTANAGTDYAANTGTVTFTSGGPLTQTITVVVNGDTAFEANETFLVNLSNPTGATIADAQGVGTIQNDDAAPPVAPVITNSPPGGFVSVPYTFQYIATGTAPITFALATGTLPPGLTLSASGIIAGSPTQAGTFTGTVTATNAAGTSPPAAFSITIGAVPPSTADIPTLSEWGLIGLSLVLALFGARLARRPR
jgi:hypothetical protein